MQPFVVTTEFFFSLMIQIEFKKLMNSLKKSYPLRKGEQINAGVKTALIENLYFNICVSVPCLSRQLIHSPARHKESGS